MSFEIPSKLHIVHVTPQIRFTEVERLCAIAYSWDIQEVVVWAYRAHINALVESFKWCNEVSDKLLVYDDNRLFNVKGVYIIDSTQGEKRLFRFEGIETLPPLTNPLILQKEVEYNVGDALPEDVIGLWAIHHEGGVYIARKSVRSISKRGCLPAKVEQGVLLCELSVQEVPFTHLVVAGAKGAQDVKTLCAALADFYFDTPALYYDIPDLMPRSQFSGIDDKNVELADEVFMPMSSQKKRKARSV